MKRPLAPFLLVVLVLIALAVGATFRYPLVLDDPFITYRYARNLLDGQGLVYNSGERVLSTTTPLYAFLLAASGLIFRDIPSVGFWMSVVGLGVCACFVYLLASDSQLRAAGLVAALLLLTAPGLLLTFGLETGLYLALAWGAIYFYFRKRTAVAFALLSLLTLTRNDGILLTAILGIHYFLLDTPYSIRNMQSAILSLARPLLVFALILAPWLVFAWWWFGTPFPFTLTAKMVQAQSGWDPFAVGFAKWLGEWSAVNWLFAGFALVGLGACIKTRSHLLLVALWATAHVIGYSLLGVAFYVWYVAPFLPAAALLAGVGVERIAREVAARIPSRLIFAAAILLACGPMLAIELGADVDAGMQKPAPKAIAYRRAAEWITSNTPPEATVDALEVGLIGYYDRRRTLDFVGLVDPARVPYLRAQALGDGVRRASADYVIAIPPDEWLPPDPWFSTAYQRVQEIRAPGFYSGRPLVIYRRADAGRTVLETRTLDLNFEKRVGLTAVDLFARSVSRGERLPVILHLRTDEALPRAFKFTLQLVGEENRVIAQADTHYPLRLPEDGRPFLDHQALPIARSSAPGQYDLILAMYDQENGERVTWSDAQGGDAGDFVSLGKIEVR